MSTLAFDTHKAVKALKEAGFGDIQAEAVVATVGDAIGGDMATKGDIAVLKTDIKADIAALKTDIAEFKADIKTDIAEFKAEIAGFKADIKTDIGDFKAEIYRHLWLMAVGIVGLTVTLVKLIP